MAPTKESARRRGRRYTHPLFVRLDDDLESDLRAVADRERRTYAETARLALEMGVEQIKRDGITRHGR